MSYACIEKWEYYFMEVNHFCVEKGDPKKMIEIIVYESQFNRIQFKKTIEYLFLNVLHVFETQIEIQFIEKLIKFSNKQILLKNMILISFNNPEFSTFQRDAKRNEP
ncbi:hypothetical protein BpHYR1_024351 [Brachionus plicatilis]|uniref:Uncharacterized protein n=1 Tax=Brachionus plicatilis TaxID=10195 RepID=A0A3M7QBP7_BRAPC|nr:hypothetical protein BpHYR1_024351 [Brachionus plicatilis]